MAISGQAIFDGKVAQYGMQASHQQFMADFLKSLNNIRPDLANDLNEEAIDVVTDVDTSLDLPTYAQAALETGLDRWLVVYGHKAADLDVATAVTLYRDARAELRHYIDLVAQRAAIAADDEKPGSGRIGLTA